MKNLKSFLSRTAILLLAFGIAACAPSSPEPVPPAQSNIGTVQPSVQTFPVPPAEPVDLTARDKLESAEKYYGKGNAAPAVKSRRARAGTTGGDVTLDFANAELRDFLRVVLGETLGLNYTVDPSAQGTITLETAQPIRRELVFPTMESTLRLNGLAIVNTDGLYRVLPAAGASRESGLMNVSRFGYTVKAVPLRYVSAPDMQQAIETLVPQGSILRVDAMRNMLLVAGSERDVANTIDTIRAFDIDSLNGLSFGLFPVKNASAKSIHLELQKVFAGTPVGNMVRIVPIDRLNAILVSSQQQLYIDNIEEWISRLDRVGESDEKRLYVYYVQNGRAADLATVLSRVLRREANVPVIKNTPSALPPDLASTISQTALALPSGSLTPPGSALGAMNNADAMPKPAAAPVAGVDALPDDTGGDDRRPRANVQITADEVNNAIIIMGSPQDYRLIESALQKLDVTPLQVLIEATISEVRLTNDLRYGVQYFFSSGQHTVSQIEDAQGVLGASFPGFNYIFTSGNRAQIILNMLEGMTNVKMLASPQLLVLNNQSARIQVGDQVPIATQSAVSTVTSTAPVVNSIQYKDTGVSLRVTPRVNAGGMVLMDITQEVSSVSKTTSSTLDSPTIQQRLITSSVAVRDGETIALGGLIRDSQTTGKTGIPGLSQIPVVGALFGVDEDSRDRTELLALITPHVISNAATAQDVTEELRRKVPLASFGVER
ncbi:MAG: type II secretion system secretin GspD [Bdellovibrionales bacterium]